MFNNDECIHLDVNELLERVPWIVEWIGMQVVIHCIIHESHSPTVMDKCVHVHVHVYTVYM